MENYQTQIHIKCSNIRSKKRRDSLVEFFFFLFSFFSLKLNCAAIMALPPRLPGSVQFILLDMTCWFSTGEQNWSSFKCVLAALDYSPWKQLVVVYYIVWREFNREIYFLCLDYVLCRYVCTYISSCMHCLWKTTEIRTNGNSIGKVVAVKFGTYHIAFFASELRTYPGRNPSQCDWWKAEASSQPCWLHRGCHKVQEKPLEITLALKSRVHNQSSLECLKLS